MSKQWRGALAAGLVLAAGLAVPQAWVASVAGVASGGTVAGAPASDHSLLGLAIEPDAQGRPSVRLDLDGKVDVQSFALDDPHRIVLDLPGVVARLDSSRRDWGHDGIVRVRASQHTLEPQSVTRVVIDLDRATDHVVDAEGSTVRVSLLPAAETTATAVEPTKAEPPPAPSFDVQPAPADALPSEPAAPVAHEEAPAEPAPARAVDPAAIEKLLRTPVLAAPKPQTTESEAAANYGSRRITTGGTTYKGKRISFNLVDADLKQVFRLFHEISGLNFVLDPNVSGRVTIVLDQVPWDQALDIILKNNGLDKVLENNVWRIATTEKLAQEAAARKRLREAEELEVEPVTLTRTLSYAKAQEIVQLLRGRGAGGGGTGGAGGGILSERGKVIGDDRTNTIIVTDIPKQIKAVDELIALLDTQSPQVMIEARIVETSKTYSRDLGVVWGTQVKADASTGTSTGIPGLHNVSARYALNLPGTGGASQLGFSFGNIVDSFTLDLALNALETEGRGRIISAPKIATQNNERAEIEQGTRIPVTNTTATEIQVEFVSASLLLQVTPQITAEGTVVLDVTVENNSPDFNNTAGGIPSIRTQRAQTKVLVADGGTTVIGGIFLVNEGDSEVGVPWFRKVPVFGWLFRNQAIQKENRELLIFLTPKIMKLG
jgi:type IV pilus assembly protein PilQ